MLTTELKVIEQFFLVALLAVLFKIVLRFDFVDEIIEGQCDHFNKKLEHFFNL